MLKWMLKNSPIVLFFSLITTQTFAAPGNLFRVTSSGGGAAVNITLCLNINGQSPISCQNYNTQAGLLSINTTIPNHTYHYVGIRINTPGYAYSATHGLKMNTPAIAVATGFTLACPAGVSNSLSCPGTIASTTSYTVGGTVSGLTGTLVLQNNGGDNKTISTNGAYSFATAVAEGSAYAVTIQTQPTNQTCTIVNGTGTVSGANVTNVNVSCINLYTGIYVETSNRLVTYSPDNGTSWGTMLSPQGGWFWDEYTWATAATTDGTMYQATGVKGTAATLIYSSDGVTWSQVHNSLPTTLPTTSDSDWVQSVFAVGGTVYVGTGNGYVYYTTDQGDTWLPNTPAQVTDGSTVNAIVVDASGHYYAGTQGTGGNGTVYSSSNSGQSWTALPTQPGGGSISSLAIDDSGTLYTVTATTTTQPQYNTAPLTTGTWQSMTALPAGDGNATTIAALGTTAYVGTDNGRVLYTSTKGVTWAVHPVLVDTSGITSLFVNQARLSPLFVEAYGIIQITSSQQGTGTVTVKNFSSTTATNVQANPSQLPLGVTQTSTPCASVAAGGSCSITFAANGTKAFTPFTFDIIDGNGDAISRSALVSYITPNGVNYYFVYNVNGTNAYVVDSANASNGIIWSSNAGGTYDGGVAIYGISETSTTSSPNPGSGAVTGQTACNGATDGSCDANNIYVYYQNTPVQTDYYAEGLCYQDTNGSAAGTGQWYLPAACELNGGIYLNVETRNFGSCSPVLTSVFSLYSLGALGGSLQSLLDAGSYWSSTEGSDLPQNAAWHQDFAPGGGGSKYGAVKGDTLGVRCSRALPL